MKLPGEFKSSERHFFSPIAFIAFLPVSTARLSHQIIEGRKTSCFLSTMTRPCIWYEIPIALTSAALKLVFALIFPIAAIQFSHHVCGCCSAQPGFFAMISSSFSGDVAEPITAPVWESRRVAFIDELPTSKPNNNAIHPFLSYFSTVHKCQWLRIGLDNILFACPSFMNISGSHFSFRPRRAALYPIIRTMQDLFFRFLRQ